MKVNVLHVEFFEMNKIKKIHVKFNGILSMELLEFIKQLIIILVKFAIFLDYLDLIKNYYPNSSENGWNSSQIL